MLQSIRLAFAMFTKIPAGNPEWNERNMRYIMHAFPLVGVLIGGIVFAWLWLCETLVFPNALRALGMTLIPIAVTGGIHLDGLCDTCDALASNASPEKRREILKDPRAGAFGVIGVAVYLLSYFALAMCLPRGDWRAAGLIAAGFMISRVHTARAVVSLPGAPDGTVKLFREAAAGAKRCGAIFMALICICYAIIALIAFENNFSAVFRYIMFITASNARFIALADTAKKKFNGMSGDLAGWALQLCEVCQLAAVVVATYVWSAWVSWDPRIFERILEFFRGL